MTAYSVKYVGVVEGNMGILSRKVDMPTMHQSYMSSLHSAHDSLMDTSSHELPQVQRSKARMSSYAPKRSTIRINQPLLRRNHIEIVSEKR